MVLVVVSCLAALTCALPSTFAPPPAEGTHLLPPPGKPDLLASFSPGEGPIPEAFACLSNRTVSANILERDVRAAFMAFGLALPVDVITVRQMPTEIPESSMSAEPRLQTTAAVETSNGAIIRFRWYIDLAVLHKDGWVPTWRDDAMRFVGYFPAAFVAQTQNCRVLSQMTKFHTSLQPMRHVATYGDGFFLLVGTASVGLLLALIIFLCRYTRVLAMIRQRTKVFDDTEAPLGANDMEVILKEMEEEEAAEEAARAAAAAGDGGMPVDVTPPPRPLRAGPS